MDHYPTPEDQLLQRAAAALKAGDRQSARLALEEIVQADPASERGWLGLVEAVESDEERRFCLQQVLAINRRNGLARRMLKALGHGPAESPLLRRAGAELEAGHKEKARDLLEQVIRAEPRSEHAWLWLADAVDSDDERRFCLQQVLAINRRNGLARRGLEALGPGFALPPVEGLEDLSEAQPVYSLGGPKQRLRRFRETLQRRAVPIAVIYLAALAVAETLTTLIEPQGGLVLYGLLLAMLISHTALTWGHGSSRLTLTLAFAPLIRTVSLFLPLAGFPLIYWYLIVSVPLFAAAATAIRISGLSGEDVGLRLKRVPLQVLVVLTGLSLGYFEYHILSPRPLAQNPELAEIWMPALVLLVCTGFAEELIFRGLMQHAAIEQLGSFWGIFYVAALFAVLHVGYQSLADVLFVFGVALFFGKAAEHTGSIAGVSLAHGLTNIILYLTMPFGLNPFDLTSHYGFGP